MRFATRLTSLLAVTALCLLGAHAARAVTIDLTPTDDMYSDPNHSDPNEVGELWVANYAGAGHYERIMMKFDLSSLGANPDIASATLHLYRFFRCPNDPYTEAYLYAGTQDWDEDTWSCRTHLPHEATPRCPCVFGPNNTWHAYDITGLVTEWADETTPNCGLVIEAVSGEKWSKLYSKDSDNPALHPYLTVDYEPGVPVEENPDAPARWSVSSYPNPFNPRTNIRYGVPSAGPVALRIHDAGGRLVHAVELGHREPGEYDYAWRAVGDDGRALPAGVYYYSVGRDGAGGRGKVVLLK